MGTQYIFDIGLEHMDVEKLIVLKETCDHYIKEKHRKEIHDAITKINLLAHSYGFDICVCDKRIDDFPQVLNERTLSIENHDDITALYGESE